MTARTLELPLHEATGDDVWLTCICCGLPRHDFRPEPVGKPVEWTLTFRGNGETKGVGLHEVCRVRMQRACSAIARSVEP